MKVDKIIINIFDEVSGDSAISVDDGDAIFKKIDKAFENKIKVILDFQNINLIITAFLNACVGQLYSKYTSEEITKYLEVINTSNENKKLFNIVIKRAKEYFSNPEDFDKSVNDVLGNE